jgi:hypothetical protein
MRWPTIKIDIRLGGKDVDVCSSATYIGRKDCAGNRRGGKCASCSQRNSGQHKRDKDNGPEAALGSKVFGGKRIHLFLRVSSVSGFIHQGQY